MVFKHEVEKAIDYIRWTRKQHRTPGHDQESEMLTWISKIRFHDKGRLPGFMFVRTHDGIQLMSIRRPDLMGKDISRMTDPDGCHSPQLFRVCQDGKFRQPDDTITEPGRTGLRSIVRDVDRQKKYEENLIYLAYHDALTG